MKFIISLFSGLLSISALAQQAPSTAPMVQFPTDLSIKFNEEGSHFIKLTALNQVWVRYTDTNPGTKLYGKDQPQIFDIGIRRLRFQFFGQLTGKVFFYTQFGQNNYSYQSKLYQGSFFHDAIVEYKVAGKHLSIGTGLTGWSGLSRYASPGVGTILSMDAPLYQQVTNSVSDQFLRKLSIYAKGKLGKLDYRLAISKPNVVQNATTTVNGLGKYSDFSTEPPSIQEQGYFQYQFLDEESNLTPYITGTYLGQKRVFNLGAGFINQNNAMWHLAGDNNQDTVRTAMTLLAADMFYDAPINKDQGTAITAYAAFSHYDLGPGYIRNVGEMNPAAGSASQSGVINGGGNGLPLVATGNVVFVQLGYLLKKGLLPNDGTIQPFASITYGDFERLADPMIKYNGGVNWLIHGKHSSKISLDCQMRPIFKANDAGDYRNDGYKGMYTLQYQISI